MFTRSPLSEFSLRDMWLLLAAVMLVVLVLGNGGAPPDSAQAEQVEASSISSQVRRALFKEVGIASMNVAVETIGGRVELSGRVRSEADRRRAEDAARSVAGVTSVSNKLAVR